MEGQPPSRRSGSIPTGPSSARAPSSPDAAPKSSRFSSPSEPRIATSKPIGTVASDDGGDRAPKIQIVAALLLLLVLVVVPLYLWRRPRVDPDAAANPATSSTAGDTPIVGADGGSSAALAIDSGSSAVSLGEMKMLECHDPGSKRTAPADCDRLPTFERAVLDAIQSEGKCAAGLGDLTWIVDVSSQRKKSPVLLSITKDGHALKSGKVATDCTSAVKKDLQSVALDPTHAHTRYKLEVVATYR